MPDWDEHRPVGASVDDRLMGGGTSVIQQTFWSKLQCPRVNRPILHPCTSSIPIWEPSKRWRNGSLWDLKRRIKPPEHLGINIYVTARYYQYPPATFKILQDPRRPMATTCTSQKSCHLLYKTWNIQHCHMGVSINGGTPIAGWFLFGKIPSFEMDENIRGTPMT